MPVKKSATKKTPVTKITPARKAAKKAVKKAVKKVSKPKASDLIKQSSHTPAIFKTTTKRPTHIHYSLEDVREVLKTRAEEEKKEAEKAPKPKKKVAAKKVAVKESEIVIKPDHKSKHHAASLDDILGLSPSIGSNVKSGPGKVPKKFAKYHRLLIELRNHVREELNLHSSDTLKRSPKEDAGDIATSVDAGTDTFDRDFAPQSAVIRTRVLERNRGSN